MKKAAKNLQPGDQIKPPVAERTWLKSSLTVLVVSDGKTDKGGKWLKVEASFVSPYDGKASRCVWRFRPDTLVTLA